MNLIKKNLILKPRDLVVIGSFIAGVGVGIGAYFFFKGRKEGMEEAVDVIGKHALGGQDETK